MADVRCAEVAEASKAAGAYMETLSNLGELGETRIERLRTAKRLERDISLAAQKAVQAKAAYDKLEELESADRDRKLRSQERRDEIDLEGLFK